MLSLFPSDALLDEIIRRVITSAFTGALWLLLALAIMRLFRVKNPAVKHVFYTLVLAKGFFALVREQPYFVQTPARIILTLQFPNPGAPLPDFLDVGTSFFRGSSSIAFGPGIVVLAATVIFLLWRFLGLMRFYNIVSHASELDRRTNETLYEILDRLVEWAQVASPKVILVNSNSTPFTVGLKRPIISLSPSLLKQLDQEEIEAVLAHEVAHIARRDYLYHWPLVLMRDVLFFNPLTYVIYQRLSFERERACDDFSLKLCGPLTLAKSLVKVAEIRERQPELGLIRSLAPLSFLSKRQSYFSRRVTELIEPKPYVPLSWPRRALFWLSAFVFFYLEIHISVLIYGTRVIFS
ncbi:MAG: M56 family metallopeptidase [Actinomycetota bacterium]|nr:M56 family metallopeptidase [Actinomycetota bacterium]